MLLIISLNLPSPWKRQRKTQSPLPPHLLLAACQLYFLLFSSPSLALFFSSPSLALFFSSPSLVPLLLFSSLFFSIFNSPSLAPLLLYLLYHKFSVIDNMPVEEIIGLELPISLQIALISFSFHVSFQDPAFFVFLFFQCYFSSLFSCFLLEVPSLSEFIISMEVFLVSSRSGT